MNFDTGKDLFSLARATSNYLHWLNLPSSVSSPFTMGCLGQMQFFGTGISDSAFLL